MGMTEAALSPLFQRVERPRKNPRPKATPQDRLVDEALASWIAWLALYLAPRDARARLDLGTAYETAMKSWSLTSQAVSNPTLQAVLADERNLTAWPKTVHSLIVDMPHAHRCSLLGNALGYSQAVIAQNIGVSQPRICIVLRIARRQLAVQLAVLEHVRRAQEQAAREQAHREGR
jgi:hypothetical protein